MDFYSFPPLFLFMLTSMLVGGGGSKANTVMGAVGGGRIKTIVVLVMENRSFDHMLGWQTRINPEINGVKGTEKSLLSVGDPNSSSIPFTDSAEYVILDAGHSFQAIREQVFGGEDTSADPPPMNGFAQQAESISPGFSKQVMSGFKPEAIPIHTTLIHEFAIFDRWFSPIPSSTQPNRQFVHSATSHGLTTNVTETLLAGLPQRTIFDNIYDAGLTFGIYSQQVPSTLIYRRLRQLKYTNKFHQYDLEFKKDAKDGKLPNYVVIEPRYFDLPLAPANDDHPTHDVREGQKLIKEVYEILRASPQWNEMLFIITYDEHGGLYDHVPTPVRNVPNPDDIVGPEPFFFKFDRLGVRVPTIMVSPWIEKGTVIHGPNGPTPSSEFEHSSIPATVKKLLNLPSDFLTKRDAWAGTFESVVLSRTTPRDDCPKVLPDVSSLSSSSSPPTQEREIKSREIIPDVSSLSSSSSPPTQEREIKNLVPTSSSSSTQAEKGTGSLSEFQEDLTYLCSGLNGDSKAKGYKFDTFCQNMCVKDANNYANNALTDFFEASKEALKEGASGSAIVSLNPPEEGKRSGKRSFVLESL